MKHARTLCALAAVFAVLVGVPWAASATVYVDPTAPGPNDGTSWSQAFTTLQPAIDAAWAAGGDEVWVAGGPAGSPVVYGEARTEAWGSASVTGSLVMKDNVHMYGGFEGYRGGAGAQETALSQRALALNLAVINGATARGGSAAYHVVVFGRSAAPTVNAILDGFHITGGNASGEPGDYHTWRGGGIYNWGSAPVIANCVIYGNSAEVSGGGVANVSGVVGPADAVLTNCVIADNTANRGADTAGNPIRGGGGVFNDVADPVIRHATIAGNTIGNAGYTLFGANSGGMYNWESSPVIDSSIIKQNTVGNLQDDILFGSLEVSVVSYTNVGYAYPVYQPDGSWTVTGGAVPAGPGNINQAPNFSGAYPFPYQAEVAPCVDAGNPASPVALDARTANRPLGAAIDMGAYEYSANGPAAVCQAATVTLDAAGNGTLTASAIDGGSSAEAGTHTLVADQTAFGCADVGTPSVSLTVTDKLGRTASCNATVTVEDVTVPVITQCAADQGVPVDASCEGTIPDMTANVIATDACGIASVTQNPTAGSTFTGSALVTFTVTDNNSNTETCTATVTGLDSDPPVITTCAGDQTLAVNASCQAAIPDLTGAVVYTDVCAVTVTQDPAAGTLVGLGDTVVTLRAEDASGNFDECTATVTVEDTADPVITSCAADQNIAADATCQAAIPDLTGAVAYTDDCAVTVTQLPAAGTLVGLGDTVVTLRAEDASGNFAECTATVTVTDAAPAAPALLAVAPDTGVAGDFITNAADITLQGTVGSAVPGTVLNVRLAPVSGVLPAVFAAQYEDIPTLGGAFAVPINGVAAMTYYMVFQTENNCGTLSAWSSEHTVIVDRTAPTITTCPADRDVTADTSCQGAIPDLTGDLVATDNVAGTLAVSQSPVAGTLAGLGATTVTMTVEDLAGNTSTCDVVVTVVDTPPAAPVLVQMIPDTGAAGDFITSATDFQLQGTVGSAVAGTLLNVRLHLVTGLLPAVYAAQYEDVPTAGGLFAVPLTGVAPGTYYLVFQTENNCGTLSAWSSEHTVVVDTAVPVITACAPDRQVAADGTCQGAVPDLTGDVAATDNVPGTLAVTQSPVAGTTVPMGDTTVTLTVTDLAGNTSTCDTTVTVADLTGPAFTACAPDRALAPGPGCTGTVPDMLAEVTATDVCGTVVDIVQSPAAGEPFTGA
ncbi:MAG TPA: HYR domain-containing protein, partial [Candidatus Hydrogenedentes bacterium]|nr:HYR domain-containing protein [Candidatus Hydrogenedentota bacterium]